MIVAGVFPWRTGVVTCGQKCRAITKKGELSDQSISNALYATYQKQRGATHRSLKDTSQDVMNDGIWSVLM
jgi:hypothetical protein